MHRLRVVSRKERILICRMRRYALLLRALYFGDDVPTEGWRAFNLSNFPGVENKFGACSTPRRPTEKPRRV